ncbi:MAG TPA: hypothetical protein DCE41_13245 [Cytophagales bacterium]|nr:hypothetical protein [Cytophagales bacterium]
MTIVSERIIGDIQGAPGGPLLLLVGGIHGNEPAGVQAIKQVFEVLREQQDQLRGRVVGVVGNRPALQHGTRFVHYDLNRCWTTESWQRLLAKDRQEWMGEDQEFFELNTLFRELSQGDYTQRICADLHTTSAENGNFIVVPESELQLPLVHGLHLPVVVDLAKYLRGTLLQFLALHGFVSFALEGGKLGTPEAVNLHEAGIWEIIRAAALLPRGVVSEHNPHPALLAEIAHALPETVQVRYHHRVQPRDRFVMRPGYKNFMPVAEGEYLADDENGPIHAPCSGLMFMPLYQAQGEDGFFIVAPPAPN